MLAKGAAGRLQTRSAQGHAALQPLCCCVMHEMQAEDDPIAPKEAIPFEAIEANPQCLLVLTPTGGHLGWCGGRGGTTGAHACWGWGWGVRGCQL